MLYCPYCGQELIGCGEDDYFCPRCRIMDTYDDWVLFGAQGYGVDDYDPDDDYPRRDDEFEGKLTL